MRHYTSVMYAIALYLYVTSRSSVNTAKNVITQVTLHDGIMILALAAKRCDNIPVGSPIMWAPNSLAIGKTSDFQHITSYISKMVQGKHIVSMKCQYE